ncbi:hypothetical protein LMG26691_04166 [Achromobacter animicus]|nr:hypothetical protein LMG26691_04166 [Achromobacter animicus]
MQWAQRLARRWPQALPPARLAARSKPRASPSRAQVARVQPRTPRIRKRLLRLPPRPQRIRLVRRTPLTPQTSSAPSGQRTPSLASTPSRPCSRAWPTPRLRAPAKPAHRSRPLACWRHWPTRCRHKRRRMPTAKASAAVPMKPTPPMHRAAPRPAPLPPLRTPTSTERRHTARERPPRTIGIPNRKQPRCPRWPCLPQAVRDSPTRPPRRPRAHRQRTARPRSRTLPTTPRPATRNPVLTATTRRAPRRCRMRPCLPHWPRARAACLAQRRRQPAMPAR